MQARPKTGPERSGISLVIWDISTISIKYSLILNRYDSLTSPRVWHESFNNSFNVFTQSKRDGSRSRSRSATRKSCR